MGVTFEEIERQFIDAGFGEQFESACSILLPRLERRSDQRSYVNCVVLTGDVYENKIMFAGLLYDMAKKVIGCRDLRVIRSVPYNNADFKDSTQEWMEAGEDSQLHIYVLDGPTSLRTTVIDYGRLPNRLIVYVQQTNELIDLKYEMNILEVKIPDFNFGMTRYYLQTLLPNEKLATSKLDCVTDYAELRYCISVLYPKADLEFIKDGCVIDYAKVRSIVISAKTASVIELWKKLGDVPITSNLALQ